MKNKKGMELAISTIILLIIGIVVLIGMVAAVTSNWNKILNVLKGYTPSETQTALDACKTQCDLGKQFDFCCTGKKVNKTEITCPALNVIKTKRLYMYTQYSNYT